MTSLLGQTFTDVDGVISNQTASGETYLDGIEIQTLVRALRRRGHQVALHRHSPGRGMSERRQFLLEQRRARYVHCLDDDVVLEPSVMARMLCVLRTEGCWFVGCAASGPADLQDVRPH